jgi:hypothetical protein
LTEDPTEKVDGDNGMTPNQFGELLGREPFVPLRLHLNNGEVVAIADPGCAWI